jgi:hypothetical protein
LFEEGFNKAEDLASKVKELVLDQRRPSHDYSPEISDEESQYSKRNTKSQETPWKDEPDEYRSKTKENDFEVTKPSTTTSQNRTSITNKKTSNGSTHSNSRTNSSSYY